MQEFAKLYWSEDLGQVLITLDGHSVHLRFALPRAVSSALRYDFDNNLAGEILALDLFSNFSKAQALAEIREFVRETDMHELLAHKRESMDA